MIDDVRIHNRALSQTEIQADMNTNSDSIPTAMSISYHESKCARRGSNAQPTAPEAVALSS